MKWPSQSMSKCAIFFSKQTLRKWVSSRLRSIKPLFAVVAAWCVQVRPCFLRQFYRKFLRSLFFGWGSSLFIKNIKIGDQEAGARESSDLIESSRNIAIGQNIRSSVQVLPPSIQQSNYLERCVNICWLTQCTSTMYLYLVYKIQNKIFAY